MVRKAARLHSQWLMLLIPLAISASVWLIYFAVFSHAAQQELEGAFYVVGFANFLLFAFAGPLTGIVLSMTMRTKRVGLAAFVGLFLLTTSPILWFQAAQIGVSVMQLFLRQTWTIYNLHRFTVFAAILAVCIYGAFSIVLYPLAKKSTAAAALGAAALFLGSLALIILQVIHPFIP
jgi:hypothetical protein